MVNVKAGKIISIFSIVYGILNFIINISGSNVFGMIISVGLIAVGIISFIKINKDVKIKGLVIIMLIFWFLLVVISFIFINVPVAGPIIFIVGVGFSIAPIISGFMYLSSLKKESVSPSNKDYHSIFLNEEREHEVEQDKATVGETIVEKLNKIEDLYNNGHISKEEYTKLRKQILEENI